MCILQMSSGTTQMNGYSSFNHIIDKASHYCDDHKIGMSACFLRVGEEATDVVEECYGDMGYELAYVSTPTY